MLDSTVLEVAIGLIFCFASVALIASSINEAIASALKLRSRTLLEGIKAILNDPKFDGLALNIYNHPLVNPIAPGTAKSEKDLKSKPSYIKPKDFAISFIDAIQTIPGNFQKLGDDINAIQDTQLKKLLQGMYARASGDIENLHTQLADWFDAGMDRVSGNYKRHTQVYCFLISLGIAFLFNIDSIHLFKTLWEHPGIAAKINLPSGISTQVGTDIKEIFDELKKMPIGWPDASPKFHWDALTDKGSYVQLIGWLLTASAALFGAPFWFDLLQRLIRVRGTGVKPNQSNQTEPSTPNSPITINTFQPIQQSSEIVDERNAIVNLHSNLNKTDESYRPVQLGERW
ncbi:hypothetical protein [Candidatus Nitrotoga sp. 1052]|uniref:hypothetical protein n=1 Tax=Candidatus Nitrotoga sp. 1052 TaxID=2886964 RepID=UPI001EF53865|nr:hypothetical protein [Candidatus Nitrotoga sp. 1052]CAH1073186.1 conserved membrane hypothetical protein [Candidatus Nitrotoga sp. 1052]